MHIIINVANYLMWMCKNATGHVVCEDDRHSITKIYLNHSINTHPLDRGQLYTTSYYYSYL